MNMFCYQCEQTAKGGCTKIGNCGKDPDTAALQDLLVHVCMGISQYAHRSRQLGTSDHEIDVFVMEALFTTVTNVNFDTASIAAMIARGTALLARAREDYQAACLKAGQEPEILECPATEKAAEGLDQLIEQGKRLSTAVRIEQLGEDVAGVQDLLLFGLKGTAAYADHALVLGKEDDGFYAYMHDTLDYLSKPEPTLDELLGRCLACGEVNLKIMELLDSAHTETYGNPEPTPVKITPVQGKAILVSGHDLKDLEELLKQTEGTGVNIYTHGEMLPAHGYPELKKYSHLVGNYGGAWQDQREEFEAFPGSILMTTNCIQEPTEGYQARIFTNGLVAWPGVTHIRDRQFQPVIDAALAAPGFEQDEEEKTILVGFGHAATLGVADKVVDAVKQGAVKHFFLIGGCDGAKTGRNYYTDFAQAVPEDCVIITLACGKYRFNKIDFGDIGGIPRLLDCGQCNDAYSAIRIAGALAETFDCGVNDLPLSMIISWYEQKAVCILLTLLHLGIKNIRLGPSLPAFVSPAVLDVLVEKFSIKPVTTVERDLEAALAGA